MRVWCRPAMLVVNTRVRHAEHGARLREVGRSLSRLRSFVPRECTVFPGTTATTAGKPRCRRASGQTLATPASQTGTATGPPSLLSLRSPLTSGTIGLVDRPHRCWDGYGYLSRRATVTGETRDVAGGPGAFDQGRYADGALCLCQGSRPMEVALGRGGNMTIAPWSVVIVTVKI